VKIKKIAEDAVVVAALGVMMGLMVYDRVEIWVTRSDRMPWTFPMGATGVRRG